MAAELLGIHRNTTRIFYHRLRELIVRRLEDGSPFVGQIKVDERYFGGHRKGKNGQQGAERIPVFGLLKQNGRVYTQLIPRTKRQTRSPILEVETVPDSIVYTDDWPADKALDVSAFRQFCIAHRDRSVEGQNQVNGVENFLNQAKRHLRKYNGIPHNHFNLFLKESEWRFNTQSPQKRLKELRKWVKEDKG